MIRGKPKELLGIFLSKGFLVFSLFLFSMSIVEKVSEIVFSVGQNGLFLRYERSEYLLFLTGYG